MEGRADGTVLMQCRAKRSVDEDIATEHGSRGAAKKTRAALGTLTNAQIQPEAGAAKQGSAAAIWAAPAPVQLEPPPNRRITRSVSASRRSQAQKAASQDVAVVSMEIDGSGDSKNEQVLDHVDIDKDEKDPAVVTEYIDEIYAYLRSLERKFRPKSGYMRKQRDINHGMRTILVDWLVEVAEEYKLNSHTLYIAVGYIDRFLSEMSVQRGKLQLVGVTSMLLASKYEEIYPPAVDEFVYITDNTYSRDQILKMENLVLKVLQFDMGAVTSYSFADRFCRAANADERTRNLMQYLMELTLQDGEKYLKYRPSVVAASCVCVAMHTLGLPHWTSTLQHYTDLSRKDIAACVTDVYNTFASSERDPHQAVREKYTDSKFMRVAKIPHQSTPPKIVDYRKS